MKSKTKIKAYFRETDVVLDSEIKDLLNATEASPFDKKIAEKHLQELLDQHQIKVVSWSKSSCGWARNNKREVKIPKPTNIDKFCVAMHELGHIIKDATKRKMPLYKSEYIAECFALEQARLFNWDILDYKERARRYVILCIAKGHLRNLNLNSIEQEIKDFCGVDFEAWKGKKVFVSGYGIDVYKNKPLEILIS